MIARVLGMSLLTASALLLTIAKAPAVESAPMRKLVYSFQRGTDRDVTVKAQPSPPNALQQSQEELKASREGQQYAAPADEVPQSNGDVIEQTDAGAGRVSAGTVGSHSAAESSGTIEVDVLREQTDHGLVVSIRERAKSASGAAVTCVVYPSTALICDSQHDVNPEEYSLLRFLGEGFVDPSQMDAQRHWRIVQNGAGVDSTADYRVVGDANGALTIDETQTIGSKPGIATTIRSTIDYDFNRSLPTSIDERVTQNQRAGASEAALSIHTVLRLVSATP